MWNTIENCFSLPHENYTTSKARSAVSSHMVQKISRKGWSDQRIKREFREEKRGRDQRREETGSILPADWRAMRAVGGGQVHGCNLRRRAPGCSRHGPRLAKPATFLYAVVVAHGGGREAWGSSLIWVGPEVVGAKVWALPLCGDAATDSSRRRIRGRRGEAGAPVAGSGAGEVRLGEEGVGGHPAR